MSPIDVWRRIITDARKSWVLDLRETRLATGDARIVEHTENDAYWGAGGDGSGKNRLGQILMRVREELRSQ